MQITTGFPKQQLSYKAKNKTWRKNCIDWADKQLVNSDGSLRKSFKTKRINYDLYDGKIHMDDLSYVLNPNQNISDYIPKKIVHYPIINDTLNVLIGEEAERRYEFQIRVSNPDAISDKERQITERLRTNLVEYIKNTSESEDVYLKRVEELANYFKYEYQDLREIRANYLVNHYIKELDFKLKWNQGFKDVLIAGEELYQIDIQGGDLTFDKLNTKHTHVLFNGRSSRVEDADMILLHDYWSPGKIIDVFYDQLKPSDVEKIENYSFSHEDDEMYNEDERKFYGLVDLEDSDNVIDSLTTLIDPFSNWYGDYTDENGNIRVLRVYWKSKRKIQRVKSYDPNTGEELYNFHTEDYVVNSMLGEESEIYWINEAWEGTKIGKDIYINMRPRPVQYNRMSNPSKCHFGIIGQIYNTNGGRAVSLLDRLKPSSYLYDVIKDKLTKAISRNYGHIMELDLAKIPDNWEVDKWLWFAKKDGIAIVDSFKEGNKGAATGKLAGHFNTTGRTMDLSTGNDIQMYISILDYIERNLASYSGITPQRKGAISNRETVGGVERSVVQSSFITQELFSIHNNVKKRCLEALIETAKVALRGKNLKLQYISDDYANMIFDLDGDEFSEVDYGIIVDDDVSAAELSSKVEALAQAGIQNQLVSFSTIMQMMKGTSLSKVIRLIESDEKETKEQAANEAQSQREVMQQQIEATTNLENKKLELDNIKNIRDNETKLNVALLNKENNTVNTDNNNNDLDIRKLEEDIRLKEESLKLERDKLQELIRSNKAKEMIQKTNKTKTSK